MMILFTACQKGNKENGKDAIAKVGDKYLYRKDLASAIPNDLNSTDSTRLASDYIQRWIHQELILQKAEENLTSEQKNVQHELEEYRASLLIHKYQEEWVRQRLDTVVTEKDIRDFYDHNPEKFNLNQDLIQGIYMEVPKEVGRAGEIKKWMLSNKSKDMSALEVFSFQYATKYDNFSDKWMEFSRIESRLPMEIMNADRYLHRNNFIETTDSTSTYYVAIKDFRLKGEKAPFNFVKDRIENLILNSRKMELIKELEKKIYEKGEEEDLFTIMK
ncbi:hypothetical protein PbJCM13498_25620 [Prolixibacter bellariivorans]|uniref:PpiC domain-containing protein n=2 Tax=Prolixibacter bellariivorans TaxID=314319 RepID=A0A5M4B0K3_9BACT|nr:hypothetical protein PbJCM13498_25620 [Prolixibacter bellariivorans]